MADAAAGIPQTRRDRARAETLREIKQTARRVLVEHGPDGLALRAIAREMGMTAPALYRYFASREDLVENVVVDLYDELVGALETARDAAGRSAAVQLLAACRAFRGWATTHPAEFGLLFGSADGVEVVTPVPPDPAGPSPVQAAAIRFGSLFGQLVVQIWLDRHFPVPAEEDIDPTLRAQLLEWVHDFPMEFPLGVARIFLTCWIRLYGMVCMEVFGHLKFALHDARPLFEDELHRLAELLGVADAYTAPD